MKKLLAVLCTLAMLISVFSMSALAEGEDLVFTGYCAVTDDDAYAFVSIKNNTDAAVNLYNYSIGYAGKDDASRIKEIVDIKAGTDWVKSGMEGVPANPDKAELGAGQTALIWWYQAGSIGKTVADFRAYWGLDENTMVICLDGNTSNADMKATFNLNENSKGTYMILDLNGETTLTAEDIATLRAVDTLKVDPEGGVGAMKETVSYMIILQVDLTGANNAIYTVPYNAATGDCGYLVDTKTTTTLAEILAENTTVAPEPAPGGDIDDTSDFNTAPLYAVLVLGIAVVAIASKKRFAK